jgi:hypothetical protein
MGLDRAGAYGAALGFATGARSRGREGGPWGAGSGCTGGREDAAPLGADGIDATCGSAAPGSTVWITTVDETVASWEGGGGDVEAMGGVDLTRPVHSPAVAKAETATRAPTAARTALLR